MRHATLCYLVNGDYILLGLKKRGFAEGILNGYGGKIEPNEGIESAAIREMREESSVLVNLADLENVGMIDTQFNGNKEWGQHVYVFLARKWVGVPTETDEMKPIWYKTNQIPYDRMWADEKIWLPLILQGKKIRGYFEFGDDNKSLIEQRIEIVKGF